MEAGPLRLIVMRHAKTGELVGGPDFERALTERGRRDAAAAGARGGGAAPAAWSRTPSSAQRPAGPGRPGWAWPPNSARR
jgi:broad specificity phosphatase PhoE